MNDISFVLSGTIDMGRITFVVALLNIAGLLGSHESRLRVIEGKTPDKLYGFMTWLGAGATILWLPLGALYIWRALQ